MHSIPVSYQGQCLCTASLRLVLSLCLTKDLILCTGYLCLTKANAFAQQVLHQVYSSLSIPSSSLFLLGPWFTECGSSGQVCCIRLGGVSPTEVRAEMQRVQDEQPFYTLRKVSHKA